MAVLSFPALADMSSLAGAKKKDASTSDLTGKRIRNTTANNRSKTQPPTPIAPLLNPSFYAGYAQQVAGLQQNLAAAMALKRAQIQQARGTATQARFAAREQAVQDTAAAVNAALDRGILGSSIDMSNRAAVLAQLAANKAAIAADRGQAIAQAKLQGMQAIGEYYLGLGNLAAQQAAQQAELAVQQYQADLLNVATQKYSDLYKQVLNKLLQNYRGRRRDLSAAAAAGAMPGNIPQIALQNYLGARRARLLRELY
jgi:hypothetical protein